MSLNSRYPPSTLHTGPSGNISASRIASGSPSTTSSRLAGGATVPVLDSLLPSLVIATVVVSPVVVGISPPLLLLVVPGSPLVGVPVVSPVDPELVTPDVLPGPVPPDDSSPVSVPDPPHAPASNPIKTPKLRIPCD
jgi:hypothetical protein